MSDTQHLSKRELRKRLLLVEAESQRMELLASVRELRNPMLPLQHAPMLLGLIGNKSALLARAANYVSGKRLDWLVKAVPLALAGWRIAKLLQRLADKRRMAD